MIARLLRTCRNEFVHAEVAELVDALASGASDHYGRAGSTPVLGTIKVKGAIDRPFLTNRQLALQALDLRAHPWAL